MNENNITQLLLQNDFLETLEKTYKQILDHRGSIMYDTSFPYGIAELLTAYDKTIAYTKSAINALNDENNTKPISTKWVPPTQTGYGPWIILEYDECITPKPWNTYLILTKQEQDKKLFHLNDARLGKSLISGFGESLPINYKNYGAVAVCESLHESRYTGY